MVNFFLGRPIFATVLALLMLMIGGICLFLLPIGLYPQIAPPQILVTTTYTGADAMTVAETTTTPIEQQINGIKGMLTSPRTAPVTASPGSPRRSTSAPTRTSRPSRSRTGSRRRPPCSRPRPGSSA